MCSAIHPDVSDATALPRKWAPHSRLRSGPVWGDRHHLQIGKCPRGRGAKPVPTWGNWERRRQGGAGNSRHGSGSVPASSPLAWPFGPAATKRVGAFIAGARCRAAGAIRGRTAGVFPSPPVNVHARSPDRKHESRRLPECPPQRTAEGVEIGRLLAALETIDPRIPAAMTIRPLRV